MADENERTENKTCMGVSLRAGQDVDPFVELAVGDLLHPSLKAYTFHPDMIDNVIQALQIWQERRVYHSASEVWIVSGKTVNEGN